MHLERLRSTEFDTVRDHFKPGRLVLELGGGSGYQASLISRLGCDVTSLDIPGRNPPARQYFPVQEYDGSHIPAPDHTYDIVFSSHVLEHVYSLPTLLQEMHRVLRPDGLAIHIMPSASWRLWTSLGTFCWAAEVALGLYRPTPGMTNEASIRQGLQKVARGRKWGKLLMLPIRAHGAYANAVTELYFFRKNRWLALFQNAGFSVLHSTPSKLFYTGYGLAPGLSPEARTTLARLLGSSSNVFILQKRRME